ncbi:hypothetical protein F183_A14300 [Bryobacterales bacterium F-183]|nr:hypothetical protein F183_A14300 [Bryobacterales bacterium F-183]
MALDLQEERKQAHAMIDLLAPAQLGAVRTLLETMVPTLEQSLASAPVDTEELTEETAAAIHEAYASLDRGEGIPHDEILREFGLLRP